MAVIFSCANSIICDVVLPHSPRVYIGSLVVFLQDTFELASTADIAREQKLLQEVVNWQNSWKEEKDLCEQLRCQLEEKEREFSIKEEKMILEHNKERHQLKQDIFVLESKVSSKLFFGCVIACQMLIIKEVVLQLYGLVMCITKTFYITYHGSLYSRYEYISRYDVTYITYMQIIMKEQVGRL